MEGEAKGRQISEFKACLVYRASSRKNNQGYIEKFSLKRYNTTQHKITTEELPLVLGGKKTGSSCQDSQDPSSGVGFRGLQEVESVADGIPKEQLSTFPACHEHRSH